MIFNNNLLRSSLTKPFFFLIIFLSFYPGQAQHKLSSREVIDKMLVAVRDLQTVKYTLRASERRDGKIRESEQDIKMQLSPFKFYAFVQRPDNGIEVLYKQGVNNGKAVVHPKAYSPISLNLDPKGDMLRNGNHHTIFEANLNYTADLIQDAYKKAGNNFDAHFVNEGSILFDNKDCYKIGITYPAYSYVKYTVKPGEDVIDIARKHYLSEFKIKEKNSLDDYQDVKAGQVILIPNVYAKKTTLYIDKKTFMPLVQIMLDDQGLFEKYELLNFKVNPVFKTEEFNKDYKEYNF